MKAKPSSRDAQDQEVVIGLNPPAHWKYTVYMVPFIMRQPFWGHLNHLPHLGRSDGLDIASSTTEQGMVNRKCALDLVRKFPSVSAGDESNLDEMEAIVNGALGEQIAETLGATGKRIDPETSLNACIIDSLSAIDLRDWVRNVSGVEVTVFEILEGATLQSAGLSIAHKLQATLIAKT